MSLNEKYGLPGTPLHCECLTACLIMALCVMLLVPGLAMTGELSDVNPPIDAPALVLPDLSDVSRDLKDYRGQVVLVNFWATWCRPCLQEMPGIRGLQQAMTGKPFLVLAVNVEESKHRIQAFKERLGLDFVILRDGSSRTLRAWKVGIFPTSYLIDPRGRVRFAAVGPIEWDSEEAVRAVEGLLP